tara:strand:- start:138 stop:878 length:741 start_codon:yes stop_codon:yes gene_type:complete
MSPRNADNEQPVTVPELIRLQRESEKDLAGLEQLKQEIAEHMAYIQTIRKDYGHVLPRKPVRLLGKDVSRNMQTGLTTIETRSTELFTRLMKIESIQSMEEAELKRILARKKLKSNFTIAGTVFKNWLGLEGWVKKETGGNLKGYRSLRSALRKDYAIAKSVRKKSLTIELLFKRAISLVRLCRRELLKKNEGKGGLKVLNFVDPIYELFNEGKSKVSREISQVKKQVANLARQVDRAKSGVAFAT